jgi:hypothetical protein
VRAFRVRDENGKPVDGGSAFNERLTDDRGSYRIYSLLPGTYIVSAGGASRFFGGFTTGYDQDAPTFAPSSTRDGAMELQVRSGEEVNADIQYRAEPGHAISGTVAGAVQFPDNSQLTPHCGYRRKNTHGVAFHLRVLRERLRVYRVRFAGWRIRTARPTNVAVARHQVITAETNQPARSRRQWR